METYQSFPLNNIQYSVKSSGKCIFHLISFPVPFQNSSQISTLKPIQLTNSLMHLCAIIHSADQLKALNDILDTTSLLPSTSSFSLTPSLTQYCLLNLSNPSTSLHFHSHISHLPVAQIFVRILTIHPAPVLCPASLISMQMQNTNLIILYLHLTPFVVPYCPQNKVRKSKTQLHLIWFLLTSLV